MAPIDIGSKGVAASNGKVIPSIARPFALGFVLEKALFYMCLDVRYDRLAVTCDIRSAFQLWPTKVGAVFQTIM